MARSKKEQNITAENDISDEVMPVGDAKVEIVAESAPDISKTDVKTADDGIAELNKKLKEDNARLERERNEAVKRAYIAKNEAEESNTILFNSSQTQLVEQNKYLKGQYALALQNQDYNAAADLQEMMALNQAKVLQFHNGEQSIRDRRKEGPPLPLDPVEAFIEGANLGPRPAAWIRAHPEYATNQRLTQKMIAADNVADGDGLTRGTDEYFQRVEEILKINQRAPTRVVQDDGDDTTYSDAARPTSGRQTAPSAIPVSRDVSTSGTRQRTIRLSAAEAEAAEMSGITHEEYARNRDSMRADRGRMN